MLNKNSKYLVENSGLGWIAVFWSDRSLRDPFSSFAQIELIFEGFPGFDSARISSTTNLQIYGNLFLFWKNMPNKLQFLRCKRDSAYISHELIIGHFAR